MQDTDVGLRSDGLLTCTPGFTGAWKGRPTQQGKTRPDDGEMDRRGGVIWHTQGSGKSLTMVFPIRKMRSHRKLTRFKIVVRNSTRSSTVGIRSA